MIVLVARYTVRAGEEERVAEGLRRMAARVERDEPTCLTYEVARSRENASEFVLYERYPDQDAVAGHRTTPHYRELVEGEIVPLLTSRAVELLDPVVAARRSAPDAAPGG